MMMTRVVAFAALAAVLLSRCAAQDDKEAFVPVKHAWPMTEAQLDALRKMPRAEREAWFRQLDLPRYEAKPRVGEIKLDGVLDEPAWKAANVLTLREGALGGAVKFGTRARMLWDDEAVYVAFECDDPDVHAVRTKHDDNLWKHDVVELFIDPDGDSKSYVELHVAANGATSDLLWGDYRPEDDWFSQATWSRIDERTLAPAYEPKGMTSAVKVDGTLNNPDDTDKGWTVEWRIPYSALVNVAPDEQRGRKLIDSTLFRQLPVEVPKPGTVWRMNFNRCDDSIKVKERNAKDAWVDVQENSAWAPTTGSNHMPFLFGRVTFVK